MKNKKVVLSVLSAAVVSSMASSAFAAELKNGIYLGGNVDKFYSLSSFFSDANEEQAIAELEQIGGFSKTVFVVDGKAAFLNDYLKNDDAALQDPTPEMFADGPSYKEIDKDGNIVKEFEPVDPTPPPAEELEVESVSAINLKQIEVKFSKEMNATDVEDVTKYQLNGSALVTGTDYAELQDDKKTVVITLGYDATLPTKQLTQDTEASLVVGQMRDTAGSKTEVYVTSVKYTDVTVPTVTSVEVVDKNTVRVFFSEPVWDGTDLTLTAGDFTVDGGSYVVSAATAKPELKAVDLDLGSDLTAGEHSVKVNSGNSLVDYAGYRVLQQTKTFTFAGDTTAPTVSVVSASETTVRLQFSEPVNNVAGNTDLTFRHTYNTSTYQVTGADVTAVGIDKKVFDVNFATFPLPSGATKLYIGYVDGATTKVEDEYGNELAPVTLDVTTSQDTTAPTVSSVSYVDANHVDVIFSEAVNGATTLSNYTLKDAAGVEVSITGATNTTGNTYRLTTATLTGGTYTLTVRGVKDTSLAQNALVTVDKTFTAPDGTAPDIESAALSGDGKTIRVVFSEAMSDTGLTDTDNYQLSVDDANADYAEAAALPAGSRVVKVNSKTVDIVLPAANANIDGINDHVVVSGNLKDLSGNKLSTGFFEGEAISAGETLAIVANSAKAIDKKTLQFRVNKLVKAVDAAQFTDGDGNFTIATVTAANDTAKGQGIITVKFVEDISTAVDPTLDSDSTNNATKTFDLILSAGAITTELGPTSFTTSPGDLDETVFADYVAPAIPTGAITTADTDANGQIDEIHVMYSEDIQQSSVAASDYTVEGYTINDFTVSGNTVVLKVEESGAADTDATPKVTQVGSVADDSAQHNVLGAQAAKTASDAAGPVLLKAVVGTDPGADGWDDVNDTLVLTFSEAVNLDGTNLAATGTALSALNANFEFDLDGDGTVDGVAGTTPTFDIAGDGTSTLTITIKTAALTAPVVAGTSKINTPSTATGDLTDDATSVNNAVYGTAVEVE